jgi:hypothetical protein
MSEEDEKKDWPTCVFYPNIKCPVRKAMEGGIEKYIKSPLLKGTDEAQVVMKIADAFKGAFSNEWMVLHTFCQICPLKFGEDQKLMKYPPLPSSPTPPIQVEERSVKLVKCPKCGLKGIFNYCPKCGTKAVEGLP